MLSPLRPSPSQARQALGVGNLDLRHQPLGAFKKPNSKAAAHSPVQREKREERTNSTNLFSNTSLKKNIFEQQAKTQTVNNLLRQLQPHVPTTLCCKKNK
jgi:hypothetical protein